jgi:hypothetical protein
MEQNQTTAPNFIEKLWQLVNDKGSASFVTWTPHGSIIVMRLDQFSSQVLPKYFKHSNYASFVRQLNLYGFRKISHSSDSCEYAHPLFRRGNEQMFKEIRRKVVSPSCREAMTKPEDIKTSLEELLGRVQELTDAVEQMDAETNMYRSEVMLTQQRTDELEQLQSSMVEVMLKIFHSRKRPCNLEVTLQKPDKRSKSFGSALASPTRTSPNFPEYGDVGAEDTLQACDDMNKDVNEKKNGFFRKSPTANDCNRSVPSEFRQANVPARETSISNSIVLGVEGGWVPKVGSVDTGIDMYAQVTMDPCPATIEKSEMHFPRLESCGSASLCGDDVLRILDSQTLHLDTLRANLVSRTIDLPSAKLDMLMPTSSALSSVKMEAGNVGRRSPSLGSVKLESDSDMTVIRFLETGSSIFPANIEVSK